jgi:hypothetical protein
MTSLHEYEAWLDELDKKLYVKGASVAVEFGSGLKVPLVECRSADGIVKWGISVSSVIREHLFDLPEKYLLARFVRLTCEANHLNLDSALVAAAMEQAIQERHTIWVAK